MVSQTSKESEYLTKYVGDMHAVEAHILQAITKQEQFMVDGHPEAAAKVVEFRKTLQMHVDALSTRLQELGGSPTHPLKEAISSAAGFVAGLYDKVRSEEASKDIRDDYTALNLAIIAYNMLHTTALALGDTETARICETNMRDNARFVMEINSFMPELVMQELRQDELSIVDQSAVQQTKRAVSEIWRQPASTH